MPCRIDGILPSSTCCVVSGWERFMERLVRFVQEQGVAN